MKPTFLYIFIPLLLFSSCIGKKDGKEECSIDSIPLMIMQIHKCSRLYSTQVQIRKIIIEEDTKHFKGSFMKHEYEIPLPGSKREIAIPIEGTVKAYIDMSNISKDDIHKNGEKIEIVLPDPKMELTSTKIDNKGMKQHVAFFRDNYNDEELTLLQQKGRDEIIKDMSKLNIIGMAQESTAHTLIPLLCQLGYKEENIVITFRHDLNASDIIKEMRTEK